MYLCKQKSTLMRVVFFRRPKPKAFNYKPRYYDQEKEELEERQKQINQTKEVAEFRRELDKSWHKSDKKTKREALKRSMVIYLIIAIVLIYFIFFM